MNVIVGFIDATLISNKFPANLTEREREEEENQQLLALLEKERGEFEELLEDKNKAIREKEKEQQVKFYLYSKTIPDL